MKNRAIARIPCYNRNWEGGGFEIQDFEQALKRISHLMIEQKIGSNAELARRADINEHTIAGWFKDRRKRYPVSDDMVRVAQALDTSVEYLVTGDNPSAPEQRDPDIDQIIKLLEGLDHDQLTASWAVLKQFIDTNFKRQPDSETG